MSRSRAATLPPLLAALLFLGWVVAQSPHLVHHAFEEERDQEECLLAASSDRLPGLSAEIVALTVERTWAPQPHAQRPVSLATRPLAPTEARAPPPIAS